MMRSSFIVASALASGVFVQAAEAVPVRGMVAGGHVVHARTHDFRSSKDRIGETGSASHAPFSIGTGDCVGLGMIFSALSGATVSVVCRSAEKTQMCSREISDPGCGIVRPPVFYHCEGGSCVEVQAPAKP